MPLQIVGLMGMFEKRRFKKFLEFVQNFDVSNPATYPPKGLDPKTATMKEIYEAYGLDANTADFTGHSLALFRNDE